MFEAPYSHSLPSGYRMMTPDPERTAAGWFDEAARSYVEGHQACAWCGASHCVFQRQRGSRREYACINCDFFVCHDEQTAQFHATPGKVADPDPKVLSAS
jgi:hypothetical protein